ncbi:hypothetical protein XHV734_3324 [Xanthomonas hortorum pv. vitians]|nr:hypothetical protein XHV734_3324 [Xanthomonas hortorum pv. vitians]
MLEPFRDQPISAEASFQVPWRGPLGRIKQEPWRFTQGRESAVFGSKNEARRSEQRLDVFKDRAPERSIALKVGPKYKKLFSLWLIGHRRFHALRSISFSLRHLAEELTCFGVCSARTDPALPQL